MEDTIHVRMLCSVELRESIGKKTDVYMKLDKLKCRYIGRSTLLQLIDLLEALDPDFLRDQPKSSSRLGHYDRNICLGYFVSKAHCLQAFHVWIGC